MATADPPRTMRLAWLLWPVAGVLLAAALGCGWVWTREVAQRQDRIVPTLMVGAAAAGLVLLWCAIWLLLLSRLSWPRRLAGLAGGGVLLGALAYSIEIRGFSGDVMPILGWRLSRQEPPPFPGHVEVAIGLPAPTGASSDDFPQILGPARNGSVSGPLLARSWAAGPRELWRRPVGAAWSGFAVVQGLAVTQEQRGERELVTAHDLCSGEVVWTHAETCRWEDPVGGPGPRATPAIHGGRVFALGGTGRLVALELHGGRHLWSVDVIADSGAEPPMYGVSASPLVIDDTVVVAAGGPAGRALVAYDVASGERRWSAGDGPPAHGSPVLAELGGQTQIVVLNAAAVAGHDVLTGRVLWQYPWPVETEKAFSPLALPGDRLFVSTGYGVGGKLLLVRADARGQPAVSLAWESPSLKAKFANAVHRAGSLYGLDDGILVCVDAATGERRWKGGRYGHGQVLLSGDLLIVAAEDGRVALVQATPERFTELGAFSALHGKTWNHPALAGAHLLVRNDREAAYFELPLAQAKEG